MAKPIIVAFTANGVAYTIDGESGLYYPGARLRSVEDLVHISYFLTQVL